ncbi:uncharacterized protein PSFLO_05316 [Pseudozyma flocculosa]|uniref:Uncharacterized protein n=2 Tax=Pseudozyma flocculosa TaxID=84751 RepID=A0A5C3F837_9BASI|nr:uncharacterized protein PSFLO_05316 [Pseudozyma flocculosa]
MMSVEATPVRRKLFAAPAHSPSSSVPLEHSPILSSTTRYVKVPASVPRSLATMAGGSTTPVKARAGSSSSTSSRNRVPPTVPATPTDAPTTPRNARLHRPSPVSGPKPKSMVEPSPSTERHADSLALQARWASIQAGSTSRPRTPVPSDGEDGDSQGMVDGHHQQQGQQRLIDAADAGVASPRKSSALKSLPKKKYRVSKEEIAIAHEIAGSGPMGSPSPCKVASFSDGYFAARNDDDNDIHAARAGGSPIRGSPRRRSQSLKAEEVDIYALPEAIGDDVFSNAHLRQLSASKLFGDIKRRAPLGWTVYEDPVVDKQIDAAETKPMQDLHVLASPLAMSVPSTPNKENKRPLAEAEGDVKVEHGAEASPVGHNSARKRGTGGRLSLLAKAEDEVVDSADQATESRLAPEAAAVETTTVTSPPKKSRLSGNPKPESDTAPVHAAVHRSPDAVRGRSTRKASATGSATARKPAAAAAPAVASGGVASRTRSKVRTAL